MRFLRSAIPGWLLCAGIVSCADDATTPADLAAPPLPSRPAVHRTLHPDSNLTDAEEADLLPRFQIQDWGIDVYAFPPWGYSRGPLFHIWTEATVPFGLFWPRIRQQALVQLHSPSYGYDALAYYDDYTVHADGFKWQSRDIVSWFHCDRVGTGTVSATSQHDVRWSYWKMSFLLHFDRNAKGQGTDSCPERGEDGTGIGGDGGEGDGGGSGGGDECSISYGYPCGDDDGTVDDGEGSSDDCWTYECGDDDPPEEDEGEFGIDDPCEIDPANCEVYLADAGARAWLASYDSGQPSENPAPRRFVLVLVRHWAYDSAAAVVGRFPHGIRTVDAIYLPLNARARAWALALQALHDDRRATGPRVEFARQLLILDDGRRWLLRPGQPSRRLRSVPTQRLSRRALAFAIDAAYFDAVRPAILSTPQRHAPRLGPVWMLAWPRGRSVLPEPTTARSTGDRQSRRT